MSIRSVLLLLLVPVALCAAALDGTWASHVAGPDGNFRDTFFAFHQDGSALTGTVGMPWGDFPIQQGTVTGNHFSFFIEFGDPSARQRVPWEGDLVNGEMHLKSTPPKRPATEYTAKPADPSITAQPAKLPIPALKTLPWNHLTSKPPMGWNSLEQVPGANRRRDRAADRRRHGPHRNGRRKGRRLPIREHR